MKKQLVIGLSAWLVSSSLAFAQAAHVPVNINTADQATLAAVSGIGKHKAQAIVEYRKDHGDFKDIHDLTHVKGITEKSLKNILKHNPNQFTLTG